MGFRAQTTVRTCARSERLVIVLDKNISFGVKLPLKETFELLGQRWRRAGRVPRWTAFLTALPRARRTASVGLLVLFLLVPYSSVSLLLAEYDSPGCGSSCCKRSRVCGCRKSVHNAHQHGPDWSSSLKCPCGCGEPSAVQPIGAASLVTARSGLNPIAPVAYVRPAYSSACGSPEAGFALFGRPPPTT